MKNHIDLIHTISKLKEDNLFHIFLIPNQTSLIITKLIITLLNLKQDDFILIPLRNTDTSIIKGSSLIFNTSLKSKILARFFNYSLITEKIKHNNKKKNRPFILYTSWAYFGSITTPSVESILDTQLCKGHFYIEEGQLSYRFTKPYSKNIKKTNRTTYAMDSKYIFRNDSLGFISILDDAYPGVKSEKKFVLKNYDILKEFYKPKIKGFKTIGLTCAERRLKNNEWKPMIVKLVENMPEGGLIKLHPSFSASKKKRKKIESFLKHNYNFIALCSDDIIIELEMLHEKKKLIGSLTSLNKYADAFGSEFIKVDLY